MRKRAPGCKCCVKCGGDCSAEVYSSFSVEVDYTLASVYCSEGNFSLTFATGETLRETLEGGLAVPCTANFNSGWLTRLSGGVIRYWSMRVRLEGVTPGSPASEKNRLFARVRLLVDDTGNHPLPNDDFYNETQFEKEIFFENCGELEDNILLEKTFYRPQIGLGDPLYCGRTFTSVALRFNL